MRGSCAARSRQMAGTIDDVSEMMSSNPGRFAPANDRAARRRRRCRREPIVTRGAAGARGDSGSSGVWAVEFMGNSGASGRMHRSAPHVQALLEAVRAICCAGVIYMPAAGSRAPEVEAAARRKNMIICSFWLLVQRLHGGSAVFRTRLASLACFALLVLSSVSFAQDDTNPVPKLRDDLMVYHRPIRTKSPEAQNGSTKVSSSTMASTMTRRTCFKKVAEPTPTVRWHGGDRRAPRVEHQQSAHGRRRGQKCIRRRAEAKRSRVPSPVERS